MRDAEKYSWSEPYRRHTDKLTREPTDNPLAVLGFLFVMCMAVFGAIALATGWVPHR